jgi:hypothetical protein
VARTPEYDFDYEPEILVALNEGVNTLHRSDDRYLMQSTMSGTDRNGYGFDLITDPQALSIRQPTCPTLLFGGSYVTTRGTSVQVIFDPNESGVCKREVRVRTAGYQDYTTRLR